MTLFPPDDAYDALEGQGSSQPLADDQHGQGHGQHQRLSLHGKEKTLQFVPQHFDQAPASSCGPAVTPELHLSASAEELQELQDDASMVTARAHDGGHMVGQPARLASIFTKDFYKKVGSRRMGITTHGVCLPVQCCCSPPPLPIPPTCCLATHAHFGYMFVA